MRKVLYAVQINLHVLYVISLQRDKFTCALCDFTTESNLGLKIHIGKMHEVKCDTCSEKFNKEISYRHTCVESM